VEIRDEFRAKLQQMENLEAIITTKTNSLMEFAASLITLKQDTLLSLYKWFSDIQQAYELGVDSRIAELSLVKEKTEARLATVKRLESDLSLALEPGGVNAVVGAEDLCRLVVSVNEKATEGLDQPQPLPAEHGLQPGFSTARLCFRKFLSLQSSVSQTVEIDGNTWRVKLGRALDEHQKEYLSVTIELVAGFPIPSQVRMKCELESTTLPSLTVSHEYTGMAVVGQGRGWKRFHPFALLQSEGHVDATGALRFLLSIRPESYEILWKWLRWSTKQKGETIGAARRKLRSSERPAHVPPLV
jgi:hypothetical protein